MTRTRWTPATVLTITLLVAACGGSSATPTPGSTSPAATTGSAATVAPASQGSGATGIGGAVTALGDLTSYKFAIGMAAEGAASFPALTAGGSLKISGTVITQPAVAMDMAMTTTDKTGASSTFAYKVVDGKAYMSMAPDQWVETSAADAQSTIDSFKPENFMASFGGVDNLQVVGDETKNGVATTHYKGAAPTGIGSTFGLPTGTWTMEAWVAKEGGFLVSSALIGEATEGKFSMTMDVTDLNSGDNKVEAPATFTPIGG
jgi:hypothetical protein